MIRLQEIQRALQFVVGWRQGYTPETKIAGVYCEPESGLTVQDAHPLLTLENVRSIMPVDFTKSYPEWDDTKTYERGEKVSYNGKNYVATTGVTFVEPGDDVTEWEELTPLADFANDLLLSGINTAVQTFIQEKQLTQETKSLLERRALFDGAARLKSTIDNVGKIVGLEIVPVRSMGVTTKIERIGLQMTGVPQDGFTLNLYLFHSSQDYPMKTIPCTLRNSRGAFTWIVPSEPIYLPYRNGGNFAGIATPEAGDDGGAWFLCYNQDDLPTGMEALNVSKDWSVEPCQTCLGGSIESWRQITKYLQVSPFCIKAPQGWSERPAMFDIGRLGYTNTMNYGMNLEISVGCDLSDFIIEQRAIFANVIQKQVAAQVLRTIAMNPDVRVNRNQVNVTRDNILYELDGAPQGRPSGIGYELKQAYKALSFDTKGLDRICLQCNNHGVKYRTV